MIIAQPLPLTLEGQFLLKSIGHPEIASIEGKIEDQRIGGGGMPVAPNIESDGTTSVVEVARVNGIQISSVGTAQRLRDEEAELFLDVAPERVGHVS